MFFATQVLSRFALAQLLLSSGVLGPASTVFHIGIAGFAGGYVPQADDIDLENADKTAGGNVGFMKRGPNACALIDCFTKVSLVVVSLLLWIRHFDTPHATGTVLTAPAGSVCPHVARYRQNRDY